jgi:hypothetical protein
MAARCYLKEKKEARVNKLATEMREGVRKPSETRKNDIKCYNFGETGHIARECRKPRNFKKSIQAKSAGAGDGPPERRAPSIGRRRRQRQRSVNYIGGGNRPKIECVRLQTDVSNGRELALLVDTGADISLLKPDNLDKTRFDPDGKVRVKSVDGSTIETLGTVKTVVKAHFLKIPFTFQLVSKQVDVPCEGY